MDSESCGNDLVVQPPMSPRKNSVSVSFLGPERCEFLDFAKQVFEKPPFDLRLFGGFKTSQRYSYQMVDFHGDEPHGRK